MPSGNAKFDQLVSAGRSVGEVVSVNRFLVTVKGLEGVPMRALVLFENGDQGMIREVHADSVVVLNLNSEDVAIGTMVALENDTMSIGAGPSFVGRIVSAMGMPLDGKGPVTAVASQPIFATAPGVIVRQLLDKQVTSGIAAVDALFPIVHGQRIAVLGDSKSGKSAFTTALTISQKGTGVVVIYVMISKRKVDVDTLVSRLEESGALAHTIVVVSSVFDSLAQSYLAPYTAAALGEWFWQNGQPVIMIYDDLASHAKVYREISLLGRVHPGRDSYPGDTFYQHSSLLERAGRLASNGATMTTLPIVITPNDDITAYLPTSIMSITDGQIIFDLKSFREGIRPAVNAGLSVSRVGGRGQNKRQKAMTQNLFKKLADYRQAAGFSHFGSELALEAQADLELGTRLFEAMRQTPTEIYNVVEQQLILETVLKAAGKVRINVGTLKKQACELAANLKLDDDAGLDAAITKLLADNTIHDVKKLAAQAPTEASQPNPTPEAKAK